MIRNLLSNAIKFTPSGGTITAGAEADSEKITVYVKDTGTGIPSEIQEKLLKGREVNSISGVRHEKGHGLGLNLCKDFLAKLGENIWFESREGKGSTFYFTLQGSSEDSEK